MAYLNLFRELWRYAGKQRWQVVAFITLHILSHIHTFVMPLIFGQILNILQEQPPRLLAHIEFWLFVWLISFLFSAATHRLGRTYEFKAGFSIHRRFLHEHYTIITELPMQWHTDHHSGDTINRLNKAAAALRDFTIEQYSYVENFANFAGPIVALSIFSPAISAMALLASLGIMAVTRYYDLRLEKIYQILNELEHKLAGAIYDYIGNIKTVIILKLGMQTANEIDHRISVMEQPYMLCNVRLNGFKWFVVPFLDVLLGLVIIFAYIVQKLHRNQPILVGSVSAIYQYTGQLSGAFMNFAMRWQKVINWNVDYMAAAPIRAAFDQRIHAQMHAVQKWDNITISKLDFSYSEVRTALDDIAFSIAAGEKIAFVGESGCGKSSLMGLLRGLYAPQAVNLKIDGKEFDTLTPLAGFTTLIPQEPEIFENTLRYNITFGVEHSEQEVLNAMRLARFDAVLERLPNGLETDVRERGVTLSGGERQRLALARGVLAASDSSLILMDEPTSSVDAYNEALIYENIFDYYGDRAIIASIHRLHMLNKFTRVIVMDNGRIVQTGTFEELKASEGAFQNLWRKSQDA